MKSQTFLKMGISRAIYRWARWAGLSLLTSCTPQSRPPGPYPVGVASVWATEPHSGKPMAVEVWYPAVDEAQERSLLYGDLYPGWAARDAALRSMPQKTALIVVGHGLKSSRFDMSWLAEALASDGMIVAAVDHPGTSAETWDSVEGVKMWRRAEQLSAVIDNMLGHASFGAQIDRNRIGALGHSAGGSAVFLLAGAQLNAAKFAKRYPASAPVVSGAGHDTRVQAVIALAPGTGRTFDAAGLQKMRQPALICSGAADGETPDQFNAAFYHAALPHSIWHSMPDVGHYTFKPVCNWYGKLRSRGVCLDKYTVSRSQVHKQIIGWCRSFLAEHLPPPGP